MAYASVKTLPRSIQRALENAGYRRKDIDWEVREKVSLLGAGGAGRQEFAIIINLSTGEYERLNGSWGGANPFNPTNRVDNDDRQHALGENCAVIKGSTGGQHGVFAHLYLSSANVIPQLEAGEKAPLRSRQILYCYKGLKAGPYRQEALSRLSVQESEIADLVSKGYLKKDGRGIQITTEGKNAVGSSLGGMPSE